MMLQDQLKQELQTVAQRFRWRNLWVSIALVWATLAMAGSLILLAGGRRFLAQDSTIVSCIVLLLIATLVCCIWSLLTARSTRRIAHQLESKFTDLDSRLLTALDQSDDQTVGFLKQRVTRQALEHNHIHPWRRIVKRRTVLMAQICAILCVVAFGAQAYMIWSTPKIAPRVTSNFVPSVEEEPVVSRTEVSVAPGNSEVERGRPMVITAEFSGDIPGIATLVTNVTPSSGKPVQNEIEMSRALNDPLFAKRIPSVPADFEYSVNYPGGHSETFKITVYDLPELVQMDVLLKFPEYTSLSEKLVSDTRRVSAVIGTEVEVVCRLNKPVASASLDVDNDDASRVALSANDQEPKTYRGTFKLERSLRFKLNLQDNAGRVNRDEIELVVNAIENRPPKIVVTKPGRDITVSAIEEVPLQATMIDDFGLAQFGLTYTHGENEPVELSLGEDAPANAKQIADYLLQVEELNASAGDLISYYFWAEDSIGDFDADSRSRRVLSDMYFAEVRPFEEIYRESQQSSQPSQQQQQQQQAQNQAAEQLLQLQKQIISATWNTIRRESSSGSNQKMSSDIELIEQSQRSAIDQLAEAADQFTDVDEATLRKIESTMQLAADSLKEAVVESSQRADQLQRALLAEQQIYQQLLKLKPDEFDVQQSSQQQSSSSSQSQNSRSQQQLQQLELSNEQNRYEQQQQAMETEDEQQRENRQTLNRLRELAARQEDLNEQLKELQTALDAAETEEDREEIERQLKRLREQQEEVLRDIDELKERTENSANREEMAETAQQLDEAREQVRRSAEALDRQEMSQAAAAGEKAQQQFEELRDEMRRRTAGEFTEQMEQMRDKASELKEKQDQIEKQLADRDQKNANLLRDEEVPEDLDEKLSEQRERLGELLEEMQNVVREAEESEPLLSRQLYDTFREAKHNQVEESLELSRELVDRGLMDEAREVGKQTSEGIDEFKRGIDRAAESVLGDETEALKRARDILDRLGNELENEIAQNDPNAPQTDREGNPGEPSESNTQEEGRQNQDSENSESGNGDTKQGDTKQGDSKRGESKDGESKDGQAKQGTGRGTQQADEADQQTESKSDSQSKGESQSKSEGDSQSQSKSGSKGDSQSGKSQGTGRGEPNDSQSPQDQSGQGNQTGEQQPSERQSGEPNDSQGSPTGNPQTGQFDQLTESWQNEFGGTTGATGGNPITGENFREWSDQLRDVEEMLDDDDLRARAADIREQAREIRIEFKRHSENPKWEVVREFVAEPLEQLKADVARELLKRQSREALVPIDRQPVPPGFERMVRDYYERLGSGK